MLRATLLALSLAFSAPQVSADTIDDALSAYDRGDFDTALKTFRKLAEQGHVIAQYNLGVMYRDGKGVPQDYAEAVRWYRLAAEQGDAAAQNNLGVMYGRGQGVPQDYTEALKLYRLAADQGYAAAQRNLGSMYECLTSALMGPIRLICEERVCCSS